MPKRAPANSGRGFVLRGETEVRKYGDQLGSGRRHRECDLVSLGWIEIVWAGVLIDLTV